MANHFHAMLDHIQQLTVVDGYEAPARAPPPPTVSDFTLIDADRDEPIPAFDPVPDGATVNLATPPTRNLNLRANPGATPSEACVSTMTPPVPQRVDNNAPFALACDSAGSYSAWRPVPGGHTVTAVPCVEDYAGGAAGAAAVGSP
jgi:hypothetical protein